MKLIRVPCQLGSARVPLQSRQHILCPEMDRALKAHGNVGLSVALVCIMGATLPVPASPAMLQRLTAAKTGHVRLTTHTVLLSRRADVPATSVLGVRYR